MAEQGDIEHTLVMSDTSGTETGSKSGSLRSDIVIEGSHKTIETVDLNFQTGTFEPFGGIAESAPLPNF